MTIVEALAASVACCAGAITLGWSGSGGKAQVPGAADCGVRWPLQASRRAVIFVPVAPYLTLSEPKT